MTFAWMVDQCRPYLAFEDFTNDTIANYLQRTRRHDEIRKAKKKAHPSMKDQVTSKLGAASKYLGSFLPFGEQAVPEGNEEAQTNESAHWTLFRAHGGDDLKYRYLGSQDRTPGACYDMSTEARPGSNDRIKLRDLGRTNEWMHPSVQWRIESSKKAKNNHGYIYESSALGGFKYGEKNGVCGWQYTDKGGDKDRDVWIPEWPITAAIGKKGTSVPTLKEARSEYAEMALIEQCKDYKDVLEFLDYSAAPYGKEYSPADYKDESYVWMRV